LRGKAWGLATYLRKSPDVVPWVEILGATGLSSEAGLNNAAAYSKLTTAINSADLAKLEEIVPVLESEVPNEKK
jgi:hypothetical protein